LASDFDIRRASARRPAASWADAPASTSEASVTQAAEREIAV
jgi:hypothetical protein